MFSGSIERDQRGIKWVKGNFCLQKRLRSIPFGLLFILKIEWLKTKQEKNKLYYLARSFGGKDLFLLMLSSFDISSFTASLVLRFLSDWNGLDGRMELIRCNIDGES